MAPLGDILPLGWYFTLWICWAHIREQRPSSAYRIRGSPGRPFYLVLQGTTTKHTYNPKWHTKLWIRPRNKYNIGCDTPASPQYNNYISTISSWRKLLCKYEHDLSNNLPGRPLRHAQKAMKGSCWLSLYPSTGRKAVDPILYFLVEGCKMLTQPIF